MSNRPLSIPASLFILLALPAALAGQEREPRPLPSGLRTIKVVGVAEASVVPDTAVLVVGVETQSLTAGESLASNGKEMNSLMGVLKKQGIAIEDVQTSELNLSPVFEKPKPGVAEDQIVVNSKIIGYKASNRLSITIRDTKKVGELLDLLVAAGVNKIDSLSFVVSNRKDLMRDLRKQAIADAREKAAQGAKDSDMVLGLPFSIEILDDAPGYPAYGVSRVAPAPQATPIAMGSELLRVNVEVVYELKAPR